MKLAFALYNYFPYSGLARDFLRILTEAVSRGHGVEVYVSKWQGDQPKNTIIHVLDARGLTNHGRNAQFHRLFSKAIETKNYDAIVGFNKMPGLDIYYGADYCYVARAKPRYGPIYRLTPRYHYQHAFEHSVFDAQEKTQIFSLSPREMSVYQQHYGTPASRFVLMPPTLDISRQLKGDYAAIRKQKRNDMGFNDKHVLLFIGSGFKTKGLDRAIAALHALPLSLKNKTHLYVVGQDNAQAGYNKQIQRSNLEQQVTFLGGRDDVPDLMIAGDLLIHPAYSENTGTVILEAIISGLPVIATDVCGYAQHIQKAGAGTILGSPFEQSKLDLCLQTMLTSDERKSWRNNGIAYGKDPGLFKMPETAVDSIKQFVAAKKRAASSPDNTLPGGASIYLNDELAARFGRPLALQSIMQTQGEIIRKAPGRRTIRFKHSNKAYYLKSHTGVGWKEILKNLSYLKKPVIGAQNEWHGIHHLERIGIKTMTAAGYGMAIKNPAKRQSFIITEALENTVSLEAYCGKWATNPPKSKNEIIFKRWLIKKIAHITRDMHNSGANHRDYYLIHFLLKIGLNHKQQASPENSLLFLIDLHRMQIRKRTPYRWQVKDVAGLYFSSLDIGLTKRDLFRFMQLYMNKSLRETLLEDQDFWGSAKKRGLRVYKAEKNRKREHKAKGYIND